MTGDLSSSVSARFGGVPVLVTGGLGFIGSNVATTLVKAGAHVTILDNMLPGHGGNLRNIAGFEHKLTVLRQDVRNQTAFREAVRGKKYLFHLAAQTGHLDSMNEPLLDLDINVIAQLSMLESCRISNPDIKTVFTSTRQVYGRPHYLPVDEEHPLSPVDVNGINKLAAEMYNTLYDRVYGLRSTILRLTNTYGPRMRIRDARQMFLGVWIRSALENRPFEVWDGQQKRDFSYVDDVVEAVLLSASSEAADGKIFNLGSTESTTLQALAEHLIAINRQGSYESRNFPAERKRIDIGDYLGDFSHIQAMLGWMPQVGLQEGLERTLSYYRNEIQNYL